MPLPRLRHRRVLITGWFSVPHQGATAGDIRAGELVRDWAAGAGMRVDMAMAEPFTGGVRLDEVNPRRYDAVVVVCGPVAPDMPINQIIERFRGRPLVGVNLSVLRPLDEWDPWTALFARDGAGTLPDLTLAAPVGDVPVVGRIQVHVQGEYEAADPGAAHAAFDRLLARREAAAVAIDTRLDVNAGGLRTALEVDALITRMDVVLTTRLHGMVLALRAGVPAVVVDAVPGGAKVIAQARTLGWPHAFVVDELDDARLAAAYEACLRPEARSLARECAERGAQRLEVVRADVIAALTRRSPNGRPTGDRR